MGSTEGVLRGLILAHGAGSTADFLARAFPAHRCGVDVYRVEDRSGSTEQIAQRIAALIVELRGGYGQLFVGGVSIGAHAAVLAAQRQPLADGYVFAMPGWIGAVDPAGATARAAAEIGARGPRAVLDRLLTEPATSSDWVVDELVRAWADRPTLAQELAAAAAEAAPSAADLAMLTGPALVLGLEDDPVHPLGVARTWAELVRGAALTVLPRQAPARDRSVFGAAVGEWLTRVSEPR